MCGGKEGNVRIIILYVIRGISDGLVGVVITNYYDFPPMIRISPKKKKNFVKMMSLVFGAHGVRFPVDDDAASSQKDRVCVCVRACTVCLYNRGPEGRCFYD